MLSRMAVFILALCLTPLILGIFATWSISQEPIPDDVIYEDTLVYGLPTNGFIIDDSLILLTTIVDYDQVLDTIQLIDFGYRRTTRGWVGLVFPGYWESGGCFWPDYECPTVHHIIEWRYAGDVNMDGKVDIGDAVTIIRYIFPGYQKAAR